jgi:hypothetical protein
MYVLLALFLAVGSIGVYPDPAIGNGSPKLFATTEACQTQLKIETEKFAAKINAIGPVELQCFEYDDGLREMFPVKQNDLKKGA